MLVNCGIPTLARAFNHWNPYKSLLAKCLKQWNLDYDSILKSLGIPWLSTRRKYLKLTTIVGSNSYFPSDIFVQQSFPYSTHRHANFIRPFTHTQYIYSSFVPSVITTWNMLPNHIKHSSSISAFKGSL